MQCKIVFERGTGNATDFKTVCSCLTFKRALVHPAKRKSVTEQAAELGCSPKNVDFIGGERFHSCNTVSKHRWVW